MTHLRRVMLEELQRRNYATTTVQCYIQAVDRSTAPRCWSTFSTGRVAAIGMSRSAQPCVPALDEAEDVAVSGHDRGWRADKPITPKVVWDAFRDSGSI